MPALRTARAMVTAVMEALFVFQPLNHLARRKLQELAEFQDRLQRAAMACQDQVKDSGLKDDKAAAAMDKCLVGVFERHIKLLAPLKKRVVEKI